MQPSRFNGNVLPFPISRIEGGCGTSFAVRSRPASQNMKSRKLGEVAGCSQSKIPMPFRPPILHVPPFYLLVGTGLSLGRVRKNLCICVCREDRNRLCFVLPSSRRRRRARRRSPQTSVRRQKHTKRKAKLSAKILRTAYCMAPLSVCFFSFPR